jgi:hypothetical protein
VHYGVDVSSNNEHPMAYAAIVAYLSGLGGGATPFVIVKITQGTGYINPDDAVDVAGFRAAGAVVAGYLMDQGNASVTAEEALFARTVNLPQADDIELPEGLSVAEYIAHSHDLIAVDPAALSYLNQSEVGEGFPEGSGLWLAEYNDEPGTTSHACTVHQFTMTGTIPGAGGEFDINVWCGSEASFSAFFRIAAPAVVATPTTPRRVPDMFITEQPDPSAGGAPALYEVSGGVATHIVDTQSEKALSAVFPTCAISAAQFALYTRVD